MRHTVASAVLLAVGSAHLAPAQPIGIEQEAKARAAGFLRTLGREFDGALSIVEVSPPGSRRPDSYVVGTENGCNVEVLAQDGSVYSFHDSALELAMSHRARGSTRRFASGPDAVPAAIEFLRAMGMESIQTLRDWESPGPAGRRDPEIERAILRLVQPAPGFEGWVNEVSVEVDLVSGAVVSGGGNVSWHFSPPGRTMSREEAVAALKAAWTAGAPHYANVAPGRDLAWPGDADAMRDAALFAYPPSGARAFTSSYGEQLDRNRTVPVCWTLGHAGLSIAIDAENGKLIRSDLAKGGGEQPPQEPAAGTFMTPELREASRRYHDNRRATLVRAGVGVLALAAGVVGLLVWRRHAMKGPLD